MFACHIKVLFIRCHPHVSHIEMQNYKEEEEEIERLVNRLVEGVIDDVTMDSDQGEDSLHQLMDADMGQQATHSPLLVDMCHYSDVSSADTSPYAGQNTNEDISQGSEQPMQWHSDVNDPHVNYSEGVESMEWQEGDGPLDNVSVLGPQNDNYGNKDMEMDEEPQLADDDLTIEIFNFPHTFFHLALNRTKSFKHKQHDLVNEQSYCKRLRTQSLNLVEILYYDEQLQSMCCQSGSYSKNGG